MTAVKSSCHWWESTSAASEHSLLGCCPSWLARPGPTRPPKRPEAFGPCPVRPLKKKPTSQPCTAGPLQVLLICSCTVCMYTSVCGGASAVQRVQPSPIPCLQLIGSHRHRRPNLMRWHDMTPTLSCTVPATHTESKGVTVILYISLSETKRQKALWRR